MTKLESLLEDLESALSRLEEVLAEEKNEIVRDSAIKRFEIAFDLLWKTLKAFLEEYYNAVCFSPRNCFKEAFRQKLIDYDEFWLRIAKTRNYAAHTYSEVLAEKIYPQLPEALIKFQNLLQKIKQESAD